MPASTAGRPIGAALLLALVVCSRHIIRRVIRDDTTFRWGAAKVKLLRIDTPLLPFSGLLLPLAAYSRTCPR